MYALCSLCFKSYMLIRIFQFSVRLHATQLELVIIGEKNCRFLKIVGSKIQKLLFNTQCTFLIYQSQIFYKCLRTTRCDSNFSYCSSVRIILQDFPPLILIHKFRIFPELEFHFEDEVHMRNNTSCVRRRPQGVLCCLSIYSIPCAVQGC